MTTTGCTARYHNTASAYAKHHCRCPQAREAHRIYHKRWREHRLPPALHNPTGTHNRLRALMAIGHTCASIANHLTAIGMPTTRMAIMQLGWRTSVGHTVTTTARNRIHRAYQDLHNTPGPNPAAAATALHRGYQPPAYWDLWGGIDDDPTDLAPVVDEIAIARVLTHEAKLDLLHPHEQIHLFENLRAQGLTDGQIRHRLRLSASTTARLSRAAATTTSTPERTVA